MYFNYNPILIILIIVNTTAVVTARDYYKLKNRCIWLPEDDQ
jgi:hypothetical protein